MNKIVTLKKLATVSHQAKLKRQTIGLITGCFDVVHLGHIELFRFAKKRCDILVVGVENDQTVKLSKGPLRPIFALKTRMDFLSELISIDYLFPIAFVTKFGSNEAEKLYNEILQNLKPDYLITNPNYDHFWKNKESQIKVFGGRIILERKKRDTSTSKIANLVIKNFS